MLLQLPLLLHSPDCYPWRINVYLPHDAAVCGCSMQSLVLLSNYGRDTQVCMSPSQLAGVKQQSGSVKNQKETEV